MIVNDEYDTKKYSKELSFYKDCGKEAAQLEKWLENQEFLVHRYDNCLDEDLFFLKEDLDSVLEEFKNETLVIVIYYVGLSKIVNNNVHAVLVDGDVYNIE